MSKQLPNRRKFMHSTLGIAAGFGTLGMGSKVRGAMPEVTQHAVEETSPTALTSRVIFKAAKWDMIQAPGSVLEKFQLQKELGYDGIELISPLDVDPIEVRRASEKTGMPVHGVVDAKHWIHRLSSPDPAQRELGLSYLLQALRDANECGGSSVLLVPGRVTGANETHDDVWQRSIPWIQKSLPVASKLGVRILIENVWNGFCVDPEQFRDYLDTIGSPWVGAYFDIGNAQKFAPSEHWVSTLGSRIVKLDCKDWGQAGGFGKIGDGDVDWAAVRTALESIKFSGWCTAEVAGGDRDTLADISRRMDRVLAL